MSDALDVRVVQVTTARVRGGVWRHIEDLSTELRALGVEVSVALPRVAPELRTAARELGLPVLELGAAARVRDRLWHAHLHNTYDRALAAATLARRAVGPTVLTEHLPHTDASDPDLRPGPRHPLAHPAKTVFKRLQYACADAVIAVSPSSARFLRERYGRVGHVHVIPNGLAPGPRPERPAGTDAGGADAGPARVICAGSVIDQKGHDVLVQAAALASGRWEAEVFGEGPDRARLARAAAESGLPVRFPGWAPSLAEALARADVACVPSRWESFGYAALEAMRAGLPVVASDVDGLRELVQDGVSGLLVAPEDAPGLAAALDRLAGDPELRAALGGAGRRRSLQFTSARMTAETLAVYRAALRRRG